MTAPRARKNLTWTERLLPAASLETARLVPVRLADLKIQTKDQQLVPFACNAVQGEYLDKICPGWREDETRLLEVRSLREIVLKARQFGFSTLIAALYFLITINTPNTTTVVLAHDGDTSEELFQMVHTFYENLDPAQKPSKKASNRRMIHWQKMNSRYIVRTAGTRGSGRGLTIHNLHCSEAAFYPNPKLYTGLLQAVPASGNVFLESTANGESGEGKTYFDEYERAAGHKTDDKGNTSESPFHANFYAWWQHAEYERAYDAATFRRTDEETSLVNKFDLDRRFGVDRTNRKLVWRRVKKTEPGMGTMFPQEYPSDDKEAFLVSGTKFFTQWDEKLHTVYEDQVSIETWFPAFGGLDWGSNAPFGFGLFRVDDRAHVLGVDEVYERGLTDDDMAAKVVACIKSWGLALKDVPIYADPSMWAQKTDWSGRKVANVDAFVKAGLRMVKASNDRRGGFANMRRYLSLDERPGKPNEKAVPWFRALKGRMPNLARTMPLMVIDPRDVEDLDTTLEDHAVDYCRYGLASRPRPAPEPKKPDPTAPPPPGQPDYRPAYLRKETTEARGL